MRGVPFYRPEAHAFRKAVGREIADARSRAGCSQAVAAKRVGITQASMSNYENGKRDIAARTLFALCRLYSVPIADLLAAADPPAKAVA